MKMDEHTVERSTQFMMTGYAYDDKNSTSNLVNIPGTESGPASLECTLRPERTDARVEFVVKTEKPSDKNWTALDFRPRGWRVVNVPAQSLLLPHGTGDADGDGCTYFTTEEMPFETTVRDDNYLYTSGGFVFYMPENRKTPKQAISGEGLSAADSTPYARNANTKTRATIRTNPVSSSRTATLPTPPPTPPTWKCPAHCPIRMTKAIPSMPT